MNREESSIGPIVAQVFRPATSVVSVQADVDARALPRDVLARRAGEPERLLLGAGSGFRSFAALGFLRVQLEVEIEQLLEKIAGGPGAIVERDRFLADHQRRVRETGIAGSGRLLEVGMQCVGLNDARGEPAVCVRPGLERDLFVSNPLTTRRWLRSRILWCPAVPLRARAA